MGLLDPAPLERLAFLRISATLAVLGFMSPRLPHAAEWLGRSGFSVPDLGRDDYRQPFYLPALPDPLAWGLAAVMVASGLAFTVGFRARASGLTFAATLFYVAVADRLAAFTVSKIGPVIILALAIAPSAARYSVDAWQARRAAPDAPLPTHAHPGELRFLQAFVMALYLASALCKGRGDWLTRDDVLWTHLHDNYQTAFSHWLANLLPVAAWPVFQWTTFLFELGAPLWFGLAVTRLPAIAVGLALHALIGLMFGPIIWFSLLMMAMLIGCYAPAPWLRAVMGRLPG